MLARRYGTGKGLEAARIDRMLFHAVTTPHSCYAQVTRHLQKEGVQRFADAFDKLFQCIDDKRKVFHERTR